MNYRNKNEKRLYKPAYSIYLYSSDFLIITIISTNYHLYNCIFNILPATGPTSYLLQNILKGRLNNSLKEFVARRNHVIELLDKCDTSY